MFEENQLKLLVSLITRIKRPLYLDISAHNLPIKGFKNIDNEIERDLHFNDIVAAAIDNEEKSRTIIELIKLMRNELASKRVENQEEELNLK